MKPLKPMEPVWVLVVWLTMLAIIVWTVLRDAREFMRGIAE